MSLLSDEDYWAAHWAIWEVAREARRTLNLLGQYCPDDYRATLEARIAEAEARMQRFATAAVGRQSPDLHGDTFAPPANP